MKKPLDQTFKTLENLELKPSAKAWERIQAEIGEDKRRKYGAWYGVAAAAALFITAYSGYQYLQQGTKLVVPANVVTAPVQTRSNETVNENTKVLETIPSEKASETIAIQKTTTIDKTVDKAVIKSAPMQTQIPVNQNFVQTQTTPKTVNTETLNTVTTSKNETIDAFANIPSLPFLNMKTGNDAVISELPMVAAVSKNQSVLADISTKMTNSTCREVPEDATLSERLIAFADCKTRALIKKVDTNVVNEYKHLRGY